jgi:uncharacterized protein
MKPQYLIYIWIAVFATVFTWVLAFRTGGEDIARGEFGGVEMVIEYAVTNEERELGLSGRAEIGENFGMLFVFESDDMYGFWMKDMLVPIDIFWLDDNLRVVSSAQEISPDSYPESFYPSTSARYVFETSSGFADRNNIATGTELILFETPWFLQ